MKWMMSLALLASVAAPALAQEGPPRDSGDHGQNHGPDRGGNRDAGHPQQRGAQNGQRPQFQQDGRGGGPEQNQRPPFQQGGAQDGRGPGGRFDGPGRMPGGGQPGGGQPGGGQPGGIQVHRGDVRQQGQWEGAGGRPDWHGGPGGPGGRPDWHGGPGGPGGRPDWREGPGGPGGRPGYAGGPGHVGGPGGDPRGGDWNRGWRDDHRYDWRGWRDTHRSVYHGGGYRPPYGFGGGYRRFGIGGRIDPVFFAQDYWISDPWYYRLPPASGPFRWVRYYNDALLINVYNGMVVDEIPDFFW